MIKLLTVLTVVFTLIATACWVEFFFDSDFLFAAIIWTLNAILIRFIRQMMDASHR